MTIRCLNLFRFAKIKHQISLRCCSSKKVYIETYGCQMNFNDSEIALSILKSAGFERTTNINDSQIALLMTCAIREGAEEKIRERLRNLQKSLQKSRKRNHIKFGVLGCMAEHLKSKLLDDLNLNVDVVCGPDAYRDLPRLLEDATNGNKGMNVALSLEETYADIKPVRLSNGIPSAFISIMRGCDNMCTYCIVPFTRGRERSRPIDSIVNEVKQLSEQGIKEVILLGQNVNSYRDMSESMNFTEAKQTSVVEGFKTVYKPKIGGRRFVDLLEAVSKIDPNLRIRFTSPHPKDFPNEVLYFIRDTPNIANQLHLPAQSGSSSVLEKMGRGYTREAYLNLIDNVRNIIPDIGITSDFIAGFCGESEEDHQQTLSLIDQVKYNFVYCFPYSMRDKTRAYHRLVDDVPESVKNRRHLELKELFRKNAELINSRLIGTTQLVLIENDSKRSNQDWMGRNEANTKVIFPKNHNILVNKGDYVTVKILSSTSQTLRGEIISKSSPYQFRENLEENHCAIKMNDVNEYLKRAKKSIITDYNKWLVFGNESADMDSVIGSLVYGYLKQFQFPDFRTIPIISIESKYFNLRKDIIFWLNENGIDHKNFIFKDEITNINDSTKITLIDHHKPFCKSFTKHVVEIIDHREKIFTFPNNQIKFENIELVGSCCTLLTELVASSTINNKNILFKLLYGVILIDTENFSEAIGKTTKKDIDMVKYIENQLNLDVNLRETTTKKLLDAKSDISDLPIELLVYKDYKQIDLALASNGTLFKLACPSLFTVDLFDLLKKPQDEIYQRFFNILNQFQCDVLVVISSLPDRNVRQFILFSEHVLFNKQIVDYLQQDSNKLNLTKVSMYFAGKLYYFQQNHLLTSRKKFIPILSHFFNEK